MFEGASSLPLDARSRNSFRPGLPEAAVSLPLSGSFAQAPDTPGTPSRVAENAGDAIKVCVRVRPLSKSELDGGEKMCVRILPQQPYSTTVNLTNPSDTGQAATRAYYFDRAYWSAKESDPHYVSQEHLMDDLGHELRSNVLDGYNSCLFAYGQTGSGKTYSVLGSESPPECRGLLPRIVEDIFKIIEKAPNEFATTISYLEIYNEKIRDLLRSGQEQQLRLEVRANPKYGNFVYGLKEVPVMDWQNLKQWLDFGVKARAVASTSMNATSSRSHCIFSMEVVHKMRSGGARTQLRSKLNLVDLAGSERQKKTQATGTRLKEGAMINQSLSNLALVISRLAEFANLSEKNKEKKAMEYAPFRSSKLTFLLEDSLRGNSKTVMIAALSPAEFNYEETLSTLLFAQSVKAVKTNAKKNENLEDNLIQDLEAECERLRQLVNMDAGNSQLQELAALEEMQRKYGRDFEEQLKLAEDLQKQRETLLADAGLTAKELSTSVGLDDRTPHLLNICYDPELNGCLIYFLQKGVTCSLGAGPGTLIALKGLGMQPKMLEMRNLDDRKVILKYIAGRVLLNGRRQTPGEVQLCDNDRLIVGHAFCFRLVVPSDSNHQEDVPLETALEEMEMPDDPAYQQCLMYVKHLQSRIGDIRATQFQRSFKKVCRLVNEANELAEALCPKERLLFGAEILTDFFGTDDENVESIVRVRKLQKGKARWRDVVKSKVFAKSERPTLMDTFVTVSMQNISARDQTILLLNSEEFNQRLQHFRDIYKTVFTDHHSLEDLPLAERECWGRLPPWMAAELDQELEQEVQLEQEIAIRKQLSKGHEKSENEALLEEQLACMQQLLDAKDRRIQSLELAAEAQVGSPRRANERRHSTPSLGAQKPEAPATRRQAHRELMSRVQELIRSGHERQEVKNKMLERHFQELESCGSSCLDKLKSLRSEVRSEVESRQDAETKAQVLEEELRRFRSELEGSRSVLNAQFSANQQLLSNECDAATSLLLRATEQLHSASSGS